MSKLSQKTKGQIIASLVAGGIIVSGAVVLYTPEPETVNFNEFFAIVELRDEEFKANPVFSNVGNFDNAIETVDQRILTKAQNKPQDEKNMIEGVLIKHSKKNKDFIEDLRK